MIHRTWRQPGPIGRCLLVIVAGMAASVAASRSVEAQTATATLSGIVVDESGAALPDVQVIAANAATGLQRQIMSDADGRFSMRMLPAGSYSVTAERAGFAPAQVKDLLLSANTRGDDQARAQGRAVQRGGVRAGAGRQVENAAPSTIEVSPLEVRSVAGAGENIYRVLQTLPGVAAVNDFDSRLSVRGGGPDQNLTMMDGVEIHNPYRLFGLTSAFNPETVESFELTAGGFNAKYGDRLSSILVIENRAGTRAAAPHRLRQPGVHRRQRRHRRQAPWRRERIVAGHRPAHLLRPDCRAARRQRSPGIHRRAGQGRLVAAARAAPDAVRPLEPREHRRGHRRRHRRREACGCSPSTHNDLAAVSFSSPIGTRASSKTTVSWYRNRETLDFDGDFSERRAALEPSGRRRAAVLRTSSSRAAWTCATSRCGRRR